MLPSSNLYAWGIIEPVRGVPPDYHSFHGIGFMMPLFFPVGLNINNLLRVQLGIILFSAGLYGPRWCVEASRQYL